MDTLVGINCTNYLLGSVGYYAVAVNGRYLIPSTEGGKNGWPVAREWSAWQRGVSAGTGF